jgi:hypothetical protein
MPWFKADTRLPKSRQVLAEGGSEEEAEEAAEGAAVNEENSEEEQAEAVGGEVAEELGVGAEAEAEAEDAALSVLEHGGSRESAIDAAEEAAEVRPCEPSNARLPSLYSAPHTDWGNIGAIAGPQCVAFAGSEHGAVTGS